MNSKTPEGLRGNAQSPHNRGPHQHQQNSRPGTLLVLRGSGGHLVELLQRLSIIPSIVDGLPVDDSEEALEVLDVLQPTTLEQDNREEEDKEHESYYSEQKSDEAEDNENSDAIENISASSPKNLTYCCSPVVNASFSESSISDNLSRTVILTASTRS